MDGRAPDAYRQSSTPRRMRPTARNLRARPTIVRRGPRALGAAARRPPRARGPPCGAALDARCTGARSGRAPVHRAQAAVHVPCNAVRPRLAPGALLRRTRVLLPGPLSHAWWGCQGTRAAHPARPCPHRRRGPAATPGPFTIVGRARNLRLQPLSRAALRGRAEITTPTFRLVHAYSGRGVDYFISARALTILRLCVDRYYQNYFNAIVCRC